MEEMRKFIPILCLTFGLGGRGGELFTGNDETSDHFGCSLTCICNVVELAIFPRRSEIGNHRVGILNLFHNGNIMGLSLREVLAKQC